MLRAPRWGRGQRRGVGARGGAGGCGIGGGCGSIRATSSSSLRLHVLLVLLLTCLWSVTFPSTGMLSLHDGTGGAGNVGGGVAAASSILEPTPRGAHDARDQAAREHAAAGHAAAAQPVPPIDALLRPLAHTLRFVRDNSMLVFFCSLLSLSLVWYLGFHYIFSPECMLRFFHRFGVSSVRTRKAVAELRRKSFHLAGMLIPFVYYLGLKYTSWMTQVTGALILLAFTLTVFVVEVLRLVWPAFHRQYNIIFGAMLRKREMDARHLHFTGTSFFFLGNLLCVYMFEPTIACCASLFLVLGDLAAAIVGISFGRIKIGSKSLEGTCAMFVTCVFISTVLFYDVPLAEYVIVVGSLTACLTELLVQPSNDMGWTAVGAATSPPSAARSVNAGASASASSDEASYFGSNGSSNGNGSGSNNSVESSSSHVNGGGGGGGSSRHDGHLHDASSSNANGKNKSTAVGNSNPLAFFSTFSHLPWWLVLWHTFTFVFWWSWRWLILNDNVSIPFLSGVAMHLAFQRLGVPPPAIR